MKFLARLDNFDQKWLSDHGEFLQPFASIYRKYFSQTETKALPTKTGTHRWCTDRTWIRNALNFISLLIWFDNNDGAYYFILIYALNNLLKDNLIIQIKISSNLICYFCFVHPNFNLICKIYFMGIDTRVLIGINY